MAVAHDASSPARVSGAAGAAATTAGFTAPTDAFLVACIAFDGVGSDGITATLVDSGGLSWTTRVTRAWGETTDGGMSEIRTARTTSSVSRTVTLNQSVGTNRRKSLRVLVFTGVDVDGTPVDTVGANNEGGSTANNTTTTALTPAGNGMLIVNNCDWSATGGFSSSDLTIDTATYSGEIAACTGYKTVTSGVSTGGGNMNALGTSPVQDKWTQIILLEAAATFPDETMEGRRSIAVPSLIPLAMLMGEQFLRSAT